MRSLGTRLWNWRQLDALIGRALSAARIPGAAVAIVANGEIVVAKGYGYRDEALRQSMKPETRYPIASTTKAINATLLGMLVEEGKLAWDAPVQEYLPDFRLGDALISAQVTLRDLVIMRTGLPRHDWMWVENPITRAELTARMRHLDLSAGFRERFQYCNLTVTASGHVVEIVMGKTWEQLVQERILEPLAMRSTTFGPPAGEEVTDSFHETARRELKPTRRWKTEVAAPTGGSIHSTVEDMARWMLLNLNGGRAQSRQLLKPETLAEIHSPQIVAGVEPSAPTPHANYALGWFVDHYNGHARISHGGYLHDVNSEVTLFPHEGIGLVSFTNFGPPRLSRLINEHAFDWLQGSEPVRTITQHLGEYEAKVENIRQRDAALHRAAGTAPSHALSDYAGIYEHPGYGAIAIQQQDETLVFQRHDLGLPLQPWHYDVWAFQESDRFRIHEPHAFDRTSRVAFETNAEGEIVAVAIRLEPTVEPVRFGKKRKARR